MTNEQSDMQEQFCSLCGEWLHPVLKSWKHILSDAPLCQECSGKLRTLLYQKDWWIPEGAAVRTDYDPEGNFLLPLEDAKALVTLREQVCDSFLKATKPEAKNVFMIQKVFTMPKLPLLLGLKYRKCAVLQGFSLKGEAAKGDTLWLSVHGKLQSYTVRDAIPDWYYPLTEETLVRELGNKKRSSHITECVDGWVILDINDPSGITEGDFAAVCK